MKCAIRKVASVDTKKLEGRADSRKPILGKKKFSVENPTTAQSIITVKRFERNHTSTKDAKDVASSSRHQRVLEESIDILL